MVDGEWWIMDKLMECWNVGVMGVYNFYNKNELGKV
jgi:hypothetical protein